MTRKENIAILSKYFNIQDLVCEHTYKKFGILSWQFLDSELLENLRILRLEVLKVPLIVNTYRIGGDKSQRGFRCNLCEIPRDKTLKGELYLSAHCNGAGIDCVSDKMTAQEMRELIEANVSKFTVPVRVERGVIWLHFDVYNPMTGNMFNEF